MSSNSPQLRYLLKLLDDETPVVREAVRGQLAVMRRKIPESLLELGEPLEPEQERLLAEILDPVCRDELESSWMAWRWLPTPEAQLEQALGQLSAFLSGWQSSPEDLTGRLDGLADLAVQHGSGHDVRLLTEFLFGGRGGEARLRGNSADYYAVENSNLLWVLSNGLGNPISLCCILVLVGKRLGLSIEGCNFPGHFLARVYHEEKMWLVDCFNRGRFMLAEDVSRHHPAASPNMEQVIQQPANVETIVTRVLRNLDDAYAREDNLTERPIVRRLILKLMQG